MNQPNILFLMCDQLRADSIGALGNPIVQTPNIDRLVRRGASYTKAYSTCPVCVPARYTIRTGREPHTTGFYHNDHKATLAPGQAQGMEERCGAYLARRMKSLGYHTFGVGKYHTAPWDENLGFDVQLYCEELYDTPDQRARDDYAAFIRERHPAFAHIEQLHGERTDMYYMPQMSPLPAELTGEAWVADNTCNLIRQGAGEKPWFGFASFIAPHPPLAPPVPYNRMYNPDNMPSPVLGTLEEDHRDEQIPWMNHIIWAEDINDPHAKALRARYYGEVTYVDACIGRILDAVERQSGNRETLICFFSDHGDHLGDHHAWQKESFFEQAARVPFLVSWPGVIPENSRPDTLACLTDLFGIATTAAGEPDLRDGVDLLGAYTGTPGKARAFLLGYYGRPGDHTFKVMARSPRYKYIYFANGGAEQLFDLESDPHELVNLADREPNVTAPHRQAAVEACRRYMGLRPACDGEGLLALPYKSRPRFRIHQFDLSAGIRDFIYP